MSRLLATALTGLFLGASALAGAPAASAHATRIAADPADHSTLSTSPQRVSGTFNEALQPTFANMTVVGPDHNLWSEGDPKVTGAVISVGVRPLGPAGTYTVNYRVTSADGHVVSGSWSFELTVAGVGTPGPAAASPAQSDGALWCGRSYWSPWCSSVVEPGRSDANGDAVGGGRHGLTAAAPGMMGILPAPNPPR